MIPRYHPDSSFAKRHLSGSVKPMACNGADRTQLLEKALKTLKKRLHESLKNARTRL